MSGADGQVLVSVCYVKEAAVEGVVVAVVGVAREPEERRGRVAGGFINGKGVGVGAAAGDYGVNVGGGDGLLGG